MSDATDLPATPDPRHRPPKSSREVIYEACRWAADHGIPVLATAEPGVTCTSRFPATWECDPHFEGVSPLGAAILYRQPDCADVETAEWLAAGESRMWAVGFVTGVAGLKADPSWSRSPCGPLTTNAYLFGREIYNLAHMTVCPNHPSVRHEKGGTCPRCAAEASDSALTPIDPNAGRWER
ncbi:MAG: hypothetical protein EPN98_21675 [Phenylobacterium sp.]|uniref:hypothetical protein n=1 Tax=Phenylobacterium sp. TaxID=1871053 RepID=UPI0012293C7F|nr:hypothetical protein [Phenylobacterium sp.]TAL29055.1 MAG: hypothetical protein EPN98_21675 [Phenylobacterium sp.]